MLSKEVLQKLGKEGFIVGPEESEEAFVKRVDMCRRLAKEPEKWVKEGQIQPWDKEREFLGAKPYWIPWIYSNHKLLPWQGAAMWLFEEEGKAKFPMIQLRKGFQKGKYLFYSKEEVLFHEVLHAIRIGYEEPRFEELLAYFHSQSKIRKFLGPLFRTPAQAMTFLFLVLISLALQILSLFILTSSIFPLIKGMTLLPLIHLTFRLVCLIRDQRLLKKALKKLSDIFPHQKDVFPIVIRLKDSEIESIALESTDHILNDIEKKVPISLRWRQILAQFC